MVARELDALDLYCHILINNAGFGLFGDAVELDRERQLGIIDVNLRTATDLMLRFLPAMVARKSGAVLNVGSVAGFVPGPRMAVYFASKAYLLSISQALMQEVRYDNIRVSYVLPGSVATPFAGGDESRGADWKISADDVAEVVLNLLRHNSRSLPSRV